MYYMGFTKQGDYTTVMADAIETLPQEELDKTIAALKEQHRPSFYKCPQAVLEEIRPEWLKGFSTKNKESFFERRRRRF